MIPSAGSAATSQPSFFHNGLGDPPSRAARREPLFVCTDNCDDCDLAYSCIGGIFFAIYGIVTCCQCCSGDCLDVCTYQKLPICQKPLVPNLNLDDLPETSADQVQWKLAAAREQLSQLDQTLNRRRKVHRCASILLCPVVCLPRSIDCVLCTINDFYDDDYNVMNNMGNRSQNRRPYPETQLDLMYQFTLPFLEQDEERGRLGLRQFLSPPEVQRMTELETNIIPDLMKKAELL